MTTVEAYRAQVAAAMSEDTLERRVRDLATAYGWERIYHTHDSRRSDPGFPDLTLAHARAGRLLFAELKSQTGRYRTGQREWLDALNAVADAITTDQHAGMAEVEAEVLPCRLIAVTWRPSDLLAGIVERMLRVETHAPGLALPPRAR